LGNTGRPLVTRNAIKHTNGQINILNVATTTENENKKIVLCLEKSGNNNRSA